MILHAVSLIWYEVHALIVEMLNIKLVCRLGFLVRLTYLAVVASDFKNLLYIFLSIFFKTPMKV